MSTTKKPPLEQPLVIRLNELGKQWIPKDKRTDENNAAVENALWKEIWTLLFKIFWSEYWTAEQLDVFHGLCEETHRLYDPEESNLYAFFSSRLRLREKSNYKKRKAERKKHESIDATDEDGEPIAKIPRDASAEAEFDKTSQASFEEDVLLELSSQILNFAQNHSKKTGSASRLNYWKLFYSSDIVSILKDRKEPLQLTHERDVLQPLKYPFVDFCFIDMCRTVAEISHGKLKPTSAVVENDPNNDTPIRIPLPNEVGRYYLKKIEDNAISSSGYSQQQKIYIAEMREALTPYLKENM